MVPQVGAGFQHMSAKLWRRRCGATRLLMPARLPASFTAFHTTFGVMGTSARQLFTVPGNR